MPIWDEMQNIVKTMRAYLLGRGALSLIVMGANLAATALGWGLIVPAIVAIGGLAFSAGMRLHSQTLYENKMTDLYREDIAKSLGIAPNEVTRTDLKIAAKENEVIEQALTRQRRINIVSFATSALAAAATFGLLVFGLADQAVSSFFSNHFSANLAPLLQYASVGVVSGTSSLILHNGLEEAIGHGTGLSKAVAHDLIAAMDRDVKHGRSITPEQVYAVLVAENTTLKHSITTRFKEPFNQMTAREQRNVMQVLGVTKDMTEIAEIITKGDVPPGRLAYMIHYSRPTRKADTQTTEATPTQGKFVERLGLAPHAETSHVQRLDNASDSQLARGIA